MIRQILLNLSYFVLKIDKTAIFFDTFTDNTVYLVCTMKLLITNVHSYNFYIHTDNIIKT